MSKVTKVESIETPEYVYDPVCEAPHAYVSNGFVSHNCDEIDKGLGGMGGSGDSGTSSRIFGYFLTWLNDTKAPVFTMVTANNIQGLPPELMRKGRFDEIFATGFPTEEERLEILNIHLNKRGHAPKNFKKADKVLVAKAARGYVPAEIEAAVKDGLIDAFSADEDFTMRHVISALESMVPMSTSRNAEIQHMVAWAKANAKSASTVYDELEQLGTGRTGRKIGTRIRPSAEKGAKEGTDDSTKH